MINEESIESVGSSVFSRYFLKPLYDTYGFARIPDTVRALLTGEDLKTLPARAFGHLPRRYDKVILLLLDAFGWRFFQRHHEDYPFLDRFVRHGVASKLTSQFPSTTSAHVTTIHTGIPVGETGVYEWFIYEPTLDAVIAPLLYSFAGDRGRETLRNTPANPRTIYPRRTLYQDLAAQGVQGYVFQSREIAFSTYTETITAGAKIVPFKTLSEGLTNLVHAVQQEKGKGYFFFYYDGVDATAHTYGPDAPQVQAEIDTLLTALDRLLHQGLSGNTDNTLLILTADHGQVDVNPEMTVYVNRTLPTLTEFLKTDRKGVPLAPVGSPRDMFFHVKPEYLDDAQAMLERHLDGKAEVYRTKDLIQDGFFGPTQSAIFQARIADLVVLPYRYETVWWYEKGKYSQDFFGHHGGLLAEELETTFLVLPYTR